MQINRNSFFASANSGRGFINKFPEIFGSLEHLYIIKGGSGTGKSSFMRKAARVAEEKGYRTEYCLCSSDPDSLDGLIIDDIKLGFIDGTAPHTADPKYPGAYDEIVNMGDFWDSKILRSQKKEIEELNNRKSALYKQAYLYLESAYKLLESTDLMLKPCFELQKAEAAVQRLFRCVDTSQKGEVKTRLCEGISMKGIIKLPPPEKTETTYSLKDRYGVGYIFLSIIKDFLVRRESQRTLSFSALDTDRLNMIYLPENKALFEINSDSEDANIINMDRFIKKSEYSKIRKDLHTAQKNIRSLIDEACNYLKKTGEIHFELEKIYINAMDFHAKDAFENELLTKIFSSY